MATIKPTKIKQEREANTLNRSDPQAIQDFSNQELINEGTEKDKEKDDIPTPTKGSVEEDFNQWYTLYSSDETADPSIIKPPKKGAKSWMNKYAFISYGGNYLQDKSMYNSFMGDGNTPEASLGTAGGINNWKNPTAKNIIEWSQTLKKDAVSNGAKATVADPAADPSEEDLRDTRDTGVTGDGGIKSQESTQISNTPGTGSDAARYSKQAKDKSKQINDKYGSGGTVTGLGNLEYSWKDFSFCKHFGKIPNNYLITLRRFKLPVLDNGIIAGKERLKTEISSGKDDPEEYLTSDSARALTYMGEGTENSINNFVGFTVGLRFADHEIPLGNPGINEGIKNPNNPLDNPIDGSQLVNKLLNTNFNLEDGGTGGAFTRAFNSWALQNKVEDDDNVDDLNEYVKRYSKDFDPFSNGWQHRIYGPINVVTRTMYRTRGLRFDNETITLNFAYDLAQVGSLNPKLAMLDIISNMLALTYNSGQFYGGDYRFQRQPTNFPLPLQLVDTLERISTGDSTVDYSDFFNELKKFTGSGIEKIIEDFKEEYEQLKTDDQLAKDWKNIKESISKLGLNKESEDTLNETKKASDKKSNVEKVKDSVEKVAGFLPGFVENLLTGEDSVLSSTTRFIDNYIKKDTQFSKIAINSLILEEQYDIEKISDKIMKINPLITGEPIGEWHLTVGNPMNPVMMIGNLVCTGMSMEFGETMSSDDFPTEVKFKVTLKHGRDRDLADIESMFNLGQGRFYIPTKGSKQPWETGFSTKNTENDTADLDKNVAKRVQQTEDNGIQDSPYTDAQMGQQDVNPDAEGYGTVLRENGE